MTKIFRIVVLATKMLFCINFLVFFGVVEKKELNLANVQLRIYIMFLNCTYLICGGQIQYNLSFNTFLETKSTL